MNTIVQLLLSQSEKPTVRTGRGKNTEYRQREYLTEEEIDTLLATAGNSRNPVRDRLLILVAFRHAWARRLDSIPQRQPDQLTRARVAHNLDAKLVATIGPRVRLCGYRRGFGATDVSAPRIAGIGLQYFSEIRPAEHEELFVGMPVEASSRM